MIIKISVITVVFNDRRNIEETLKSVLSQTYSNIEYIVIDGDSKDGTIDILEKYRDHFAFFVSEKDKGIYDAMNKGLSLATGEYVIFMNSGDVFSDNLVLDKVFKNRNSFPDVIYGYTVGKYGQFRLLQPLEPFYKSSKYCPSVGICHQSVFVKTEKAKELKFDLTYKVCADHNMLYKLYKYNASFEMYDGVISEIICNEGYSDRQVRIKLKERGNIYGISKSLKFFLYLYVTYFKESIRMFLRNHEPSAIKKYRFNNKKTKMQ